MVFLQCAYECDCFELLDSEIIQSILINEMHTNNSVFFTLKLSPQKLQGYRISKWTWFIWYWRFFLLENIFEHWSQLKEFLLGTTNVECLHFMWWSKLLFVKYDLSHWSQLYDVNLLSIFQYCNEILV